MAYAYEPLPQGCHTRVLELDPALDTNSPLRGNFRYVNLETDPFYDAISYTWGDPNFTEEISIGEGSRLFITVNLRDALTRFRHATETRSIWADAICIHQADEEEKKTQIPLMKDIFRCASSVSVWLGNCPSGEALLRKIAGLSQRKTIPTTASERGNNSSMLSQLVSVPWFSRRWVIQEIVINPNVTFFCGAFSVPWLRIVQLLELVPEEDHSPFLSRLLKMREMWCRNNHSILYRSRIRTTGIMDLLPVFSDTLCADARDRIYALAGLAVDVVFDDYDPSLYGKKTLIRVDYRHDVRQVYHDFAQAIKNSWRHNDKIVLLTETDRRSRDSDMNDWDSFTPDWRLPIVRSDLGMRSSMSQISCQFFDDNSFHHTYFTGEITDIVSAPYPTYADSPIKLAWLRNMFESIKEREEIGHKDLSMNQTETASLWHILSSIFRLKSRGGHLEQCNDEREFLEALERQKPQSIVENRCVFTIAVDERKHKSPLIGIGPCHVRVGDMVYCATQDTYGQSDYGLILRETNDSRSAIIDYSGVQQVDLENEHIESRTCHFMGLAFTKPYPLRSPLPHHSPFKINVI